MKHTQIEPKSTLENHQKSASQIRGLIIVLRAMLRECLALMTEDEKSHAIGLKIVLSNQLITFYADVDFLAMSAILDNLNWAYHFSYEFAHDDMDEKITSALILSEEILAEMRPYNLLLKNDISPIGKITWQNNPCENHKQGGWYVDETGQRRFLVPPCPGVDEVCPKCDGYLPKAGAK